MESIAVLYGMEESFPPALVEAINRKGRGVRAEFLKIGGLRLDDPSRYTLVVDRISQDIPFYRAMLKHAVLNGTRVINNPFWWSADDKFFNYALATKLGVPVPKTVLLPSKSHPRGTTSTSMRNLAYPLDWQEIFDYVGFPSWLKPFDGGGWRDVYKVGSPDEFFAAYDQTGELCMTLQEGIEFTEYYRCYVIGRRHVHVMPYDPRNQQHLRYHADFAPSPEMHRLVTKYAIDLCSALGYDMNTVEFAVRDGVPYAIDYMNPAPDAERAAVGDANFEWMVETLANFAIEEALKGRATPSEYRWSEFLSGPQSIGLFGNGDSAGSKKSTKKRTGGSSGTSRTRNSGKHTSTAETTDEASSGASART